MQFLTEQIKITTQESIDEIKSEMKLKEKTKTKQQSPKVKKSTLPKTRYLGEKINHEDLFFHNQGSTVQEYSHLELDFLI